MSYNKSWKSARKNTLQVISHPHNLGLTSTISLMIFENTNRLSTISLENNQYSMLPLDG